MKTWDEIEAAMAERDRRHQALPWPARRAVDAFWWLRHTPRVGCVSEAVGTRPVACTAGTQGMVRL